MFNELSNFILHSFIQLSPELVGGNIGGYTDLRKHIKTREKCYPLIREIIIYTQNSTFQRGTNQQKLNIEMNFNIFQQEQRVYVASVYIVEVHEIIYNIHSNITPHFELIIYKFIRH